MAKDEFNEVNEGNEANEVNGISCIHTIQNQTIAPGNLSIEIIMFSTTEPPNPEALTHEKTRDEKL
jgi:hypothetical protein